MVISALRLLPLALTACCAEAVPVVVLKPLSEEGVTAILGPLVVELLLSGVGDPAVKSVLLLSVSFPTGVR